MHKRLRTQHPASLSEAWTAFTARSPGYLFQILLGEVWPRHGIATLVTDLDGQAIPVSAPVAAGARLCICMPGPDTPLCPPQVPTFPVDVMPFFEHVCPADVRRKILAHQGCWLADDQVAFCLRALVQSCHQLVQVIDPLELLAALGHQGHSPCLLNFRLPLPGRVVEGVSALPCRGHWVMFHWKAALGLLHLWASDSRQSLQGPISEVHCLLAKKLGFTIASVRFHFAPIRPCPPGLCGHLALGDLAARIAGRPPPHLSEIFDLPAYLCSAFEVSLRQDCLVRTPVISAGALDDFVALGLASLLKSKGVPAEEATARAQRAIQHIGTGKIQAAMASAQPWREIKAVANQASPSFQLILPSELEASLVLKAKEGLPVGKTRKEKKALAKAKGQAKKGDFQEITLTPEEVLVPTGVFTSPTGPLQQLRLDDVGPASAGIVLVTPEQAATYMRIPRPLSSEALGLIVLGSVDTQGSTLHTEQVRFHALCPASGEPLLINGLLMQVGDQYVVKHTPAVANLDVVKSVVQRISVYRDEWESDWSLFIDSPLRSVVACIPILRTCDQEACDCPAWHGLTSAGKPEAILEAWHRTFCADNFRPSPPASAAVFTIFIRVPLALEDLLQPYSGNRGIYLEPRGLTPREPSTAFRVIWVPKAKFADVLLLRQTHSKIVGLARLGARFGVRCAAADEPALHEAIRPLSPFLHKEGLRTYLAGPLPHGTRRESLLKLFAEIKWSARPLQPEPATPQGVWRRLQASAPPETSVLHTQHGEVLLSEVRAPAVPEERVPTVVASSAFLRSIAGKHPAHNRDGPDPLQINDPWARALASSTTPSGAKHWQQVASQVEKSVMAKVGAASSANYPPLDQGAIAASVEDVVMAKVDARLGAFEASVGSKFTSLGGRVEEVAAEVKQHESHLQSMFDAQMLRIEELLNPKRNRRE